MPPSLIHPPGHLSPGEALVLAQQAPAVLESSPTIVSSSALSALLSASESPGLWITYENLLLSCLRTGDESSAHKCLDRLVLRFGNDNERIMALGGLVKEADAKHTGELELILKEYDNIIGANDTNILITKRRIALLRSMGRFSDAAAALVQLLDFSPTDAEAWSELSDLYLSQGMYPQAIFAQEEVLILAPNAWNIHARLGEMLYMAATAPGAADMALSRRHLTEALKRFSRSIELCDDYLRGYYGLKLVTTQLLREDAEGGQAKQAGDVDGSSPPDRGTVERLNELATAKLFEIVRRSTAQESGWRGYGGAEIAAARDVLSKDAAPVAK